MQNNPVFVTSYSMVSSLGCDATETLTSLELGKQTFVKDISMDFPYPHFAQNRFANTDKKIKSSQICLKLLENICDSIKKLSDLPVFFASSTGGIRETELNYSNLKGYKLFNRHFYNAVTNDICNAYPNLKKCMTFSTACSSAGHGIYHAYKLIKAGVISKALVIGYDVLSWTTNVGFDSLKLVSHAGTKPLTYERDGISLGDGGGAILLETQPTNEPIAEIIGVDSNSDGYHISSPDPSGACQIQCMNNALKMADIQSNQVDYICAHGTGTVMNDEVELNAIKTIFAGNPEITMTSLKSFVGHTLGASAALELALCLLSFSKEKIYQPSGLGTVMDEKIIPKSTITKKVKYFFNNAFGFGGNNVVMLVKML